MHAEVWAVTLIILMLLVFALLLVQGLKSHVLGCLSLADMGRTSRSASRAPCIWYLLPWPWCVGSWIASVKSVDDLVVKHKTCTILKALHSTFKWT